MGRSTKKFLLGLATATSVLAVMGGCGGGGPALTKAEYIKEANRLCQSWEREREEAYAAEIQREASLKPTRKQREVAVRNIVLGPYGHLTSKLAELDAPDGEEEQVEAIVDAMEEVVAKIKAKPLVVLKGNAFNKANSLAKRYGLDKCHS